ncbi:MAG: stage III sporulation protein AE, partial [Clostridia bacterium]
LNCNFENTLLYCNFDKKAVTSNFENTLTCKKNTLKTSLKIRKKLILICIAICLFATIAIITIGCIAEEKPSKNQEEVEKELEDNVQKNLDNLDLSKLELWAQQFEESFGSEELDKNISQLLGEVINGNYQGDMSQFFSSLSRALGSGLLSIMPIFVTIVAICVLFSLLEGMSSGFVAKPTKEIIYFVCYCAMIVIVMAKVSQLLFVTSKRLVQMKSLMEIVFPTLISFITILGGVSASVAFRPMMSVLTTLISIIAINVVLPLFIATMIFSIVGNLSSNIKLSKLTKFFKSCASVVLGGIFSVFITFLSFQGLTSSVSDSISIKTLKFAMQSYVPVVGGYLSDGFDLMLASIVLIKNSFGFVIMLLIFATIFAPIVEIVLFSLGLKLVSGIVEPICDTRFSKMLYSISKNLNLLVATLICVGFMFLATVFLLLCCFNLGAL